MKNHMRNFYLLIFYLYDFLCKIACFYLLNLNLYIFLNLMYVLNVMAFVSNYKFDYCIKSLKA